MMLTVLGAGLPLSAAHAAEPEAIDAEFLDYLASCEGKDDNWTVVASRKERKKAATRPEPETRTPPTDAAKPQEAKP